MTGNAPVFSGAIENFQSSHQSQTCFRPLKINERVPAKVSEPLVIMKSSFFNHEETLRDCCNFVLLPCFHVTQTVRHILNVERNWKKK